MGYLAQESSVFARLPPIPKGVTEHLARIVEGEILPAVETGNFAAVTDAVFRYGHLAGEQFAAVQGGPFSSPEIARRIDMLRELGVLGVGQSSWGPTIFAFAEDSESAEDMVRQIKPLPEFAGTELHIAAPDNKGARLEHAET